MALWCLGIFSHFYLLQNRLLHETEEVKLKQNWEHALERALPQNGILLDLIPRLSCHLQTPNLRQYCLAVKENIGNFCRFFAPFCEEKEPILDRSIITRCSPPGPMEKKKKNWELSACTHWRDKNRGKMKRRWCL